MTRKEPRVALRLLERFGDCKSDRSDLWLADVHNTAAEAYLALGLTDQAIASFKAALQREREFPNYLTDAWSRFALLVAEKKLEAEYDEALSVLEERRKNLAFPVLVFIWNAASALIHAERGELDMAKVQASDALRVASKRKSDFRYHANLGLVGPEYNAIRENLQRLLQPSFPDRLKRMARISEN